MSMKYVLKQVISWLLFVIPFLLGTLITIVTNIYIAFLIGFVGMGVELLLLHLRDKLNDKEKKL